MAPYGWDRGPTPAGTVPARVVRIERSEADLVGPDGPLRATVTMPIAVGDWVATRGGELAGVLARTTSLTRADPSGTGTQILAANVDLVLVTAPADRFSFARVERELLVGWASGARPVVVATKMDEVGRHSRDPVALLRTRIAGAEVIGVSAVTGDGLDQLRVLLAPARTAVLLGPSGAGKSTLTNALLGADVQATGDVREGDRRGRHTTTSRQLLLVPGGGVLIDTPGIRAIGLADDVSIATVFPDIEALAASCRFADCAHNGEPGCAVAAALADGTLDSARHASWAKLTGEMASHEVRGDYASRREALQSAKKSRATRRRSH